MAAARLPAECFENLPPDILAQFEAWEAERATIRRRKLQQRQQLENSTLFGATANSYSETLTFSSFRIEVENARVNSLEITPQAHNEMSELISIYHPNGNGILKMQTVIAPDFVTKETLRNMTMELTRFGGHLIL